MVVYILAGCHAEAKYFADQNRLKPSQWVYLDRIEQLLGIEDPIVIRTGLWYEGSQAQKIDEWIRNRHGSAT